MDAKKIITELKKQYPGKKIILNHPKTPTEIVCEIDPAGKHPQYSSAVVVIDETKPHYHQNSAEIYYVLKGKLELFVEGVRYSLSQERYRVIPPGKVHFAKGKATWVLVYSEPGWLPEDNLEVGKKPKTFLPDLTKVQLLAEDFRLMIDFYQQSLGLTVIQEEVGSAYVEFAIGDASLVITKPDLLPEPVRQKLTENQRRTLIQLRVRDLDSVISFLKEKKVDFYLPLTRYPDRGVESFYIQDPEGNLLEIYSDLE